MTKKYVKYAGLLLLCILVLGWFVLHRGNHDRQEQWCAVMYTLQDSRSGHDSIVVQYCMNPVDKRGRAIPVTERDKKMIACIQNGNCDPALWDNKK